MKNLKIQQLMMVVAIMLVPLFTSAQPGLNGPNGPNGNGGQFGRKGGGFGNSEMWMDRIPDLTDQQKTDIKAIHTAAQQDILPLRNKLNEQQASLQSLQTANSPDMKAINKTIDEISATEAQIGKRRAEAHQDVRKLLTDDQRVALDSQFQRRGRNGGQGRLGNGGQGRPCPRGYGRSN